LFVRSTTTQPLQQLPTLSDLLIFEPLVRHHGLIEVLDVRPHALASLHTWCACTKTLISVAKPKMTMTLKSADHRHDDQEQADAPSGSREQGESTWRYLMEFVMTSPFTTRIA